MTLATVDLAGSPDARMVLLRGADAEGFTFFTNFGSVKGRELAAHPRAALVFYWQALNRQVRVQGRVERVAEEESAAYFHSRPHRSQLAAWASAQSSVLASREPLEEAMRELEARYQDGDTVPLPEFWGGYRVVPDTIEFWQGRRSRLHDRFRYSQTPEGWIVERLSP
jgi:pyridoxamine 5'-phosphate oxidase